MSDILIFETEDHRIEVRQEGSREGRRYRLEVSER